MWIAQQKKRSADAMERTISATRLIRRRDNFGQIIVPAKGSVLASPDIADWDPEPDYFFHWLRDSAIVMRSVVELMEDAADKSERARWRGHFDDFVRFSLRLCDRDGATSCGEARHATRHGFRKFLRPPTEILRLRGDKLLAEPRFNPDRSIDIFRWSRPQYDGPALRALACLRYLAAGGAPSEELRRLLHIDLAFTLRHAGKRCIGPWEEPKQKMHHYYVGLVQLGALRHGRDWAGKATGEWAAAQDRLLAALDRHWSPAHQIIVAMRPASGRRVDDWLDASVLLAVWDANLPEGRHSVTDTRVEKTQSAIENLFSREFPINRRAGLAPMLGRYRRDHYFGGGGWYPTTLAAAGLYYRRARDARANRVAFFKRGDALMQTVRRLTPADGALSEQVDRGSGRQTSARHLSWSYAAFVGAACARQQALDAIRRARK